MTPASGTLTPAFDPDVYEYSLTVPFEVTTMTFTAEAPAGATYRVNRKNLVRAAAIPCSASLSRQRTARRRRSTTSPSTAARKRRKKSQNSAVMLPFSP